jgi:molybdopterin synthase catalytic subunit
MIAVQEDDFDIAEQYRLLRSEADNAGAIVTFTGLVREFYGEALANESPVSSLTLEHYPGMTERALGDIEQQARERWPLQACRVIHRVGALHSGDQIVFVGTASAHRAAAFEAADFIMDYLKTRAPFWKKQQRGEHSEWVESRDADYRAARRW